MSSSGIALPPKYRTFSRIASVTTNALLAMCGSRLMPVLRSGAFVEQLTGGLMSRGTSGEVLPASHDDIGISGVELDAVADAAGHSGRDQARARAEKRVIDRLAGPAVVGDRAAHAFNRLLGAMHPALLALPGDGRIV